MVPSPMISSPFIVTMRAPVIAMTPAGVSAGSVKPTRTPAASALGSSSGAPGTRNAKALRSSLVNRRSPRPKCTLVPSPDQAPGTAPRRCRAGAPAARPSLRADRARRRPPGWRRCARGRASWRTACPSSRSTRAQRLAAAAAADDQDARHRQPRAQRRGERTEGIVIVGTLDDGLRAASVRSLKPITSCADGYTMSAVFPRARRRIVGVQARRLSLLIPFLLAAAIAPTVREAAPRAPVQMTVDLPGDASAARVAADPRTGRRGPPEPRDRAHRDYFDARHVAGPACRGRAPPGPRLRRRALRPRAARRRRTRPRPQRRTRPPPTRSPRSNRRGGDQVTAGAVPLLVCPPAR